MSKTFKPNSIYCIRNDVTPMAKILVVYTMAIMVALLFVGNVIVYAETDWKGDAKWGDTSHGDNNPTEKEFWNVAEDNKLHSLAKCIDHMDCKDHNIDWDKFKETKSWTNATEDEKFCIVESEDLGNTLVDYELLDCYKNPDYYQER